MIERIIVFLLALGIGFTALAALYVVVHFSILLLAWWNRKGRAE